MKAIRRFTVRPVLPEALAPLQRLARNLRWSWHPPTRELFASMDPDQWESSSHDPIKLLGRLSGGRLEELAEDPSFVSRVDRLASDLEAYLSGPRWYQGETRRREESGEPRMPSAIAYFSAEFGITGALPQYSGGLGILAGDHLKSASDLGAPIVGVGLLYGAGYFRQSLTRDGRQAETYPVLDPDNLPLTLLREEDGTPALVRVNLPGGRVLAAQIWRADVGRVPLLLLDSFVSENDEAARRVTDRLYGGSGEHRLQQELLLGVGGVKALRVFTRLTGAPDPEVYHCNEGHAGFLGVERVREHLEQHHAGVGAAIEAVRAGTVFTTHTPVPAGIDRFDVNLVRNYFSGSAQVPGVDAETVLSLGAENYPGGDPGVFNMAVMGLRMAKRANGVSKLHGETSRGMFQPLWAGFEQDEVPITSVTNGVHAPTWVDPLFAEAQAECFTDAQAGDGSGWLDPHLIDDATLWELRARMRARLIEDARKRVYESWLERGATPAELGWVEEILDENILTIGFARRVPTYKRLTLMLRDPERLTRLLTDPERPIQIIVAGKSHPADEPGIQMIQRFVEFADDPLVRSRIVFLPNYDMDMSQILLPGCDVWLNNPLRPLEASGTSGMKSALNGGLNFSILDGWWDEMYDGRNGWAIPTADGVSDPDRRDELEAAAMYDLLERTVIPRFYDRTNGIPARWLADVRHTLATLGPKVQATRMLRDYIADLYTPTAESSRRLADVGVAQNLAEWKERVRRAWPTTRIDHVESEALDQIKVGQRVPIKAFVSLGELAPEDVKVVLNVGRVADDDELIDSEAAVMEHVESYEAGRHQFRLGYTVREAGPFGYTVRILPSHPEMASTAELGLITRP